MTNSVRRTCTKCLIEKPIEDFGRKIQPNGKPGRHSWCKRCVNANNMRRRREDPELNDRINAQVRKCYQRNKEGHKAKVAQYRKDNVEWYRSYQAGYHGLRRARIKANGYEVGITYSKLFKRDKGICGICLYKTSYAEGSIDHIIPIAKGGPHKWDNVQLAHLSCNQSKNDKMIPSEVNLAKGGKEISHAEVRVEVSKRA